MALSLSISVAAGALAILALSERPSGETAADLSDAQELREVRELLASLETRVEALESKMDRPSGVRPTRVARSARPGEQDGVAAAGNTSGDELADVEPTDIHGKLSALSTRLDLLEDHENIARLAESGREELLQKRISDALDPFEDPDGDATPDSKLAGLKDIRSLWGTNRRELSAAMKDGEMEWKDLYLGVLPLAQDVTLAPGFRAEVLRNMIGSREEEIRAPLMRLLAFDEIPEIRETSIDVLLWHLDDAEVRRALLQAQQDPHEGVRQRIQRNLPKVQHFERRAAEEGRRRNEGQ
jgi:hypothetical protein